VIDENYEISSLAIAASVLRSIDEDYEIFNSCDCGCIAIDPSLAIASLKQSTHELFVWDMKILEATAFFGVLCIVKYYCYRWYYYYFYLPRATALERFAVLYLYIISL